MTTAIRPSRSLPLVAVKGYKEPVTRVTELAEQDRAHPCLREEARSYRHNPDLSTSFADPHSPRELSPRPVQQAVEAHARLVAAFALFWSTLRLL